MIVIWVEPGESMNPAAMVALIDYREIEGEERPVTPLSFFYEFSLNSSQSWIGGSYPMFFPNSGGWDGRLETLTSLSKTNAMGSL